jgi:hypothetical protein
MTTLMRNGRDRRSENPFWAIARLERVVVFGTDQRITSGPAATVAASRWRQAFTRKQAAYMAAPERFAKRQIPLAPRAPFATFRYAKEAVAIGGIADIGRFSASNNVQRLTRLGHAILGDYTVLG